MRKNKRIVVIPLLNNLDYCPERVQCWSIDLCCTYVVGVLLEVFNTEAIGGEISVFFGRPTLNAAAYCFAVHGPCVRHLAGYFRLSTQHVYYRRILLVFCLCIYLHYGFSLKGKILINFMVL